MRIWRGSRRLLAALAAPLALVIAGGCAVSATPAGDAALPDRGGEAREAEAGEARDGGDGADGGDAACPPGRTRCGAACVDVTTDAAHCGRCDHPCGPSETCNESSCASTCGSTTIRCGEDCVDPLRDPANCGGCGTVCPDALNADGVCEMGFCRLACRPGWQDRDGAPGCEYACTPSSTAEECNGADDDCDTATDEDFPCAAGRPVACATPCGTTGTGACTPACAPPPAGACTPPAETCNGRDDDCDAFCDEDFGCCAGEPEPCWTSCGSAGRRTCSAACMWSECVGTAEACDGADNDCNTVCDDGFACCAGTTAACSTSCGSIGTATCSATCALGPCTPPAEACGDGRDNDCDGATDEECGGTIHARFAYRAGSDFYLRYHTVVLDCTSRRDTNCYVTGGCVSADCDGGERCGIGTGTGTVDHDFAVTGGGDHTVCYFPSSPAGYTWSAEIHVLEGGTWNLRASGSAVTGSSWLCAWPVRPE